MPQSSWLLQIGPCVEVGEGKACVCMNLSLVLAPKWYSIISHGDVLFMNGVFVTIIIIEFVKCISQCTKDCQQKKYKPWGKGWHYSKP